MISIKYKSTLLEYVKREDDLIEAKNIRDVLKHISKNYGKDAYNEARKMLIAVNGVSISLYKNLRTELKDGDLVTFYPMCGGG